MRQRSRNFRRIAFALAAAGRRRLLLERALERFPYVPSDPATRDARCREVYDIQVQGLVKRLQADGRIDRVVIGVSGGLDSTQALIVCARAMDRDGPAAHEHPCLHDAGLRDDASAPCRRRGG